MCCEFMNEPLQQLIETERAMNANFVAKQQEIHFIFIALLAKRNVLLIGPPGVAKSSVIQQFIDHFVDITSFTRLISPTTQPDELFGSAKFDRLREGVIERQIDGQLPTAHFAFLDELFKSTSDLLNGLLKIMNEHQFENGTHIVQSPLFTLVGASNEFPDSDELSALYDRFLIRLEVESLKTPTDVLRMLQCTEQVDVPPITYTQLCTLQQQVANMPIPQAMYELLVTIHFRLKEAGIVVSDRRTKQCLDVLRAEALLQQHAAVGPLHFHALKHCLWTDIEERETVEQIINEYVLTARDLAFEKGEAMLREMSAQVDAFGEEDVDVVAYTDYAVDAYAKWQVLVAEIKQVCDDDEARTRFDTMQRHVEQLLTKVLI